MRALLLVLFLLPAASAARVTVFVAPDASFPVLQEFLASAKEGVVVSTYTFDSPDVMDLLVDAGKRNVSVSVLAEANPVGGLPDESAAVFCELQRHGIAVYVHTDRRILHAKYIVRDNASVLVSTENFGPSGYPKHAYGNRGWGAVVEDSAVAGEFLAVFAEARNEAAPYRCTTDASVIRRRAREGVPRFSAKVVEGNVTAVFAPDAVDDVVRFVTSANASLRVEQFYIYLHWGTKKAPQPSTFLDAVLSEARNGTAVRVLMDSSPYNTEADDENSNLRTMEYLDSLGVEAKLADLGALGVEKIHTKGIIADDAVMVSSINWNEHSPLRNREAAVIITGDAAAYFRSVFDYDWNPGSDSATGRATENRHNAVIALALAVCLVLIILFVKRRQTPTAHSF